MCKWVKHGDTRIDPCMVQLINYLKNNGYVTLGCCCGHGKYAPTVVVKNKMGLIYELLSKGMPVIPRSRRFYKRDNQCHYYIPEVINHGKIKS